MIKSLKRYLKTTIGNYSGKVQPILYVSKYRGAALARLFGNATLNYLKQLLNCHLFLLKI